MVTLVISVSQPRSLNYSASIFIWIPPEADPKISSISGEWSQEAVREWGHETWEGRKPVQGVVMSL